MEKRVPITNKFCWQLQVEDKDLTTAPGSPSKDDRYIIAGTGGNWSGGTINDVAVYNGATWDFYTPVEGWFIWVNDENKLYRFDGSSWAEFAAAGAGDMEKSTYDTNDNGIVDNSEKLEGSTKTQVQNHVPPNNSVSNAKMLDNAIHTAELYTDTGSQSGNLGDYDPSYWVEVTMNDYSFSPNIYCEGAHDASDRGELQGVNDNTNSQIGRFTIFSSDTKAYDVQWRYVKASDPERWIFAVYDKTENKILHIWESGDHPFMTDPDAFPNPFMQFKDNPDYEIYLIDNKIWDELKSRISRTDRVSKIILNEYEVDKISIPTFEGRTLIEFDEWDDRKGEIIKTYKNKTAYGKTKTLKRRTINELPDYIKYRRLKLKKV